MSDIFREVDEDLKRDRMMALWKRYGPYAIGVVVAVVLITAGNRFWTDYQVSQRAADSDAFVAAEKLAEEGESDAAVQALLALNDDASSDYSKLSLLRAAGLKREAGDIDGAVGLYDRAADAMGQESNFGYAARYLAALSLADKGPGADLNARLTALDVPENPWQYLSREVKAMVAFNAGQLADARAQFDALKLEPEAPRGLRSRAEQMLEIIEGQLGPATPDSSANGASGSDAPADGSSTNKDTGG